MITNKFGRFLIKKWLGGGRFADVYLAEDTLLGKDFALKIARGKEQELSKLIDEVKLLAELLHPNIVRFYTVEKHEGRIGIVLEYIEGQSLREIIKSSAPLPYGTVSLYMRQIAEAIEYAHSRGVLHRDLKPENILLQGKTIKITDFGLAFFMEGEMTRSVAGTPPYMAPETWKGKYSRESDIFSIGVIAYELFTGVNPFFADSIEATMKKIKKGIKPGDIPNYLPEKARQAIAKATHPDPEKRYSSTNEFLMDFLSEEESREIPILKGKSKKKEADLSEEQKEAVSSPFKYTLVVGGPGTGKSQTLVGRILYLIEKGVAPEGILITTFTNKGKEDLEERISRHSRDILNYIWIGTLHQICTKILISNLDLIGFPEGFSIMPSGITQKAISAIQRELNIDYPTSEFLRYISIAKSELVPVKNLSIGEEKKKALKMVIEAYDRWKREKGFLDYDDVLFTTYKLLRENPLIREDYNQLFTDIIVDEFQDLNMLQFEIIRLLLGNNGRLFATGDDDQSIYQWRGGRPELVRNFTRIFGKDARIYHLTRSFRLEEGIIAPAQNLISRNKNRLEKVLWSERKGGHIQIEGFEDREREAEYILSEILSEVSRGRSFNEFAILARFNYQLRIYSNMFQREPIPFSVMFTKSLMKRREVEVILNFLRLLRRPSKSLFLFFVNLGDKLISKEEIKGIRNYMKLLQEHKNEEIRRRASFLASLMEKSSSLKPSTAIKLAIEYTGILKRGTEHSIMVKSETIGELIDLAIDFEERNREGNIKGFLSYINLLMSEGLLKNEEGVKILSAHASKGLEFPVVFIVDAYEGSFPPFTTHMTRKRMEEERRLFYVALTRATEKLYILFPRNEGRNKLEPSRFLKEILGI